MLLSSLVLVTVRAGAKAADDEGTTPLQRVYSALRML
jgi:hypothetical protein